MDISESMVLTEKDYYDFVVSLNKDPEVLLPPSILIALSQTSLLFIGYSLEDIAFRVIFQGISFLLNKRESTNIFVLPGPPLGKSRGPNEDGTFGQKQKLAQEWLSKYSADMFRVTTYRGAPEQFLHELHESWNRFHIRP